MRDALTAIRALVPRRGCVFPPFVGALDLAKSRRRKSRALASQFRLRPN
jgi:hypothetical protein